MTFYEKVLNLCRNQGFSISSIGEVIPNLSITKGSISGWKKGAKPRADKIKAIADYFGVSVEYLMSEDGEKEKTALDIKSNAVFLDNSNIVMVPLYENVSAGFGVNAMDEIVGYVPCYILNDYEAQNSMCLKVWGDSMSPKIENGDIIQVVKQSSVDSGSIAVVLLDGEEGLVKRVVYGKTWIELHSINPSYPVQRFEGEDVTRVNVVGLVRKIIKEV